MVKLRPDTLNWALQHALRHGDTDIFPLSFEFRAVQHDWDRIRAYLTDQNVLDWQTRPPRNCLAPKGPHAFRIVTQLDPLDFLLFAGLLYEIGAHIEARRVPTDRNIVFSHRFAPTADGRMFDPAIGYRQFINECNQKVQQTHVSFVAVADIADFYPRLYHHPLENALLVATIHTAHISAIMRLLGGWTGRVSYGIPVGSDPARLIAEITISDVDEALLAAGIEFLRFSDDYRFFANTHSEAYRKIAFLANYLYYNHGLTLQPQKTEIMPADHFQQRFLRTFEDRELDNMRNRFETFAEELGLDTWYEPIEYEDLNEEQKEFIDSLNLVEMVREELGGPGGPDFAVISFALRRMAQLGSADLLNDVIGNIDQLHPVFPDIIRYISRIRGLNDAEFAEIGGRVLDLVDQSIVTELEYHRMWALQIFAQSRQWGNSDRVFRLLAASPDALTRRKIILGIGRSRQVHWFQMRRRDLFEESPWPRRAVLAASSCMPADAYGHWYRSIEARLDILEQAVIRWARQNPFHAN